MLHLRGLTPDHPVRAMAALGLCTILETLPRTSELAYYAYSRDDADADADAVAAPPLHHTFPHLTVRKLAAKLNSVEALAQLIMTDMQWWMQTPLLDGGPDTLRVSPVEAMPWITRIVTDGDPRVIRQLRGLMDTDPTTLTNGGNMRRTRLDFTAGRGQMLDIVRRMQREISLDDMIATLTGTGVREITGASLRWTGVNAPTAYRAVPGGEDPMPHPVGIEWLAWLGLAAFPAREVELDRRLYWLATTLPLSPGDMLAQAGIVAANRGPWAGDLWSAARNPSDPHHLDRYWEFGGAVRERRPESLAIDEQGRRFAGNEDPIDENTPVGIAEVAWLTGVADATVRQWQWRGALPPPRWRVSGSPAWSAGDIALWTVQTGRKWKFGWPDARTEPLTRWLIRVAWPTGMLAGQRLHSTLVREEWDEEWGDPPPDYVPLKDRQ